VKLKHCLIAILFLWGFWGPKAAFAEGETYVFQAGFLYNLTPYKLSELDPTFQDKRAYGLQATLLLDEGGMFDYGLSHYRLQSTSNETLFFQDGFDFIAEYFLGDKAKVVEKRPFWEKLWFRFGGKAGYFRAFVTADNPGEQVEKKTTAHYQAEGWSLAMYAAFGLGRLGSLEYQYRYHKAGAADMAPLNRSYLAYVQTWNF